MAKSRSSSFTPEILAHYDALIGTVPTVVRKGDTVPYTSLNGHMFSYLGKDGALALRLPRGRIEEFLKKYKTTNAASYGVIQKEYASVPETLLKKTSELKPYFRMSFDYVSSLKPKPTTKPKKK